MEPILVVTRKSCQMRADLEYWLSLSVEARIAALETLRAQAPGGAAVADARSRLQRVCRVAPHARR